jgi:hypothetical protein
MKPRPPRKQNGQALGPRRLDGLIADVATIARELGDSEKGIRAKVARGLLPHRRLGGRVIFVRAELEGFLRRLPGVSADEALANIAHRREARS